MLDLVGKFRRRAVAQRKRAIPQQEDGATRHLLERKEGKTLEILVLPYGCKSRPINAEPGRSVASLAARSVTAPSMRRHVSAWAVRFSLETVLPVVQGVIFPEDCIVVVAIGRDDDDTGEVVEHGTFATGGPATWEALISPREEHRCHGDPATNLRRDRVPDARGARPRTSIRRRGTPQARDNRSCGRRRAGSRRAA